MIITIIIKRNINPIIVQKSNLFRVSGHSSPGNMGIKIPLLYYEIQL